jgi:hypothetical protein
VRQRSRSEPETSRSRGAPATLPPSPIAALPPMRRAEPPPFVVMRGAAASSTRVFQPPHVSQRPCHLL